MRFKPLLAPAYTLAVIYASLQPFTGWRMPPDPLFAFLLAPLPRYLTASDITLNVLAYLPLGTLFFMALRARPRINNARTEAGAAALAVLGCGALSLTMESVQMFLPMRIASNIDLLCNSVGAALGVLAAWSWSHTLLAKIRRHWLCGGTRADAGMLVVALWVVLQAQPAPFTFGSGDLREDFGLAPWFAYAPQTYLLTETMVAALAALGIALLTQSLLLPARAPWWPTAAVWALAVGLKSACALALNSPGTLPPGAALGLAGGAAAFAACAHASRVSRIGIAAASLVGVAVMINASPLNPYSATQIFPLIEPPTHLVSFGRVMHVLYAAWPLAALAYLVLWATSTRAHARMHEQGRL